MASQWSLSRPFYKADVITPSDDAENEYISFYVGSTGDVAVLPRTNSQPVVFAGVPAGTTINLHVKKVLATGTTSTAIIGFKF
jgi:hypothetical protein